MLEIKTKDIREYVFRVLQKNSSEELTCEELSKITFLNLNQMNFKREWNEYDFSDMAYFTNLESCTLNGFVVDEKMIVNLNQLPHLKGLVFNHCQFSTNHMITSPLDRLVLNWTSINDMNNFKESCGLKRLKIIHAKEVVDAMIFKPFEVIEELDICDSEIQNVSALDELKTLHSLCLDGSKLDNEYQRNDISFSHEEEFFLIG